MVFGFITHTIAALFFMLIPGLDPMESFLTIGLPMIIVFTPATALFCTMITHTNERLKNIEELILARKRFQNLYENSPNAYLVLDPDTRQIIQASDSATEMTGKSQQQLLSLHIDEVLKIGPFKIDQDPELTADIFLKDLSSGMEVSIIKEDGTAITASMSTYQERDEDGNIQEIRVMLDDITQITQIKKALSESELAFSAVRKIGHIGNWQVNLATGKVTHTQEVDNIYGLEPGSPMTLDEGINFYYPEDRSKIEADVQRAIQKGTPWEGEYRIVDTKGNLKWTHSLGAPVMEKGKVVGLSGIVQDITRRKLSEAKLAKETKEKISYHQKLRKSLIDTVHAIALTVEKRDPYTYGHMSRVSHIAVCIAEEMGLNQHKIDGLRLAADIHDLGKIYIPAEILNRPGKLTDEEFQLIKTHSQIGYDIVKEIEFPWAVADMILQHHERLDGSGYPNGLTGDQIILESRIIAVADVLEAVTSHRPYRPALGLEKGLEIIRKERGTKLDAEVIDACIRLVETGKITFNQTGNDN